MCQSDGAVMNYVFSPGEDSLIIKLSGTAGVNERLLAKEYLTPHLRGAYRTVVVDLAGLNERGEIYVLGLLNTIKKEFQMLGCKVRLHSPRPRLYRSFQENRLEQIFDIVPSVTHGKSEFGEKNSDQ